MARRLEFADVGLLIGLKDRAPFSKLSVFSSKLSIEERFVLLIEGDLLSVGGKRIPHCLETFWTRHNTHLLGKLFVARKRVVVKDAGIEVGII